MTDNYQEIAQAWGSFDETRRKNLLAKMSPEQKKNLRTSIETYTFTGGPNNTEGQYVMVGPNGAIPVAYSQVPEAAKAGFTFYETKDGKQVPLPSLKTYLSDSAADPNLKNLSPGNGVKVEGSALSRSLSSFVTPIADAATGYYHTLADAPRDAAEEKMAVHSIIGKPGEKLAIVGKRLLVDPVIAQAKQAIEEGKLAGESSRADKSGNILPSTDTQMHRNKATEHAVAAVVPGIGPWVADVWDKTATQVDKGDIAGAVGTVVGNAALYFAPHVIGKGASMIAKAPRYLVENLTDNSPRMITELAKETEKANTDAANKHIEDVSKVDEHNRRIGEKYKYASDEIKTEREAAEHALELRRAEEAKLQQETTDYYAKEDAVKAKVKKAADAKWTPVHQALDSKTIDGGFIETPLAKITEISPEVTREIKQLVPDPEDAEPSSPYVAKRNEILKSMGHKDPVAAYNAMDDFSKANVDRAVAAEGFTPDPIDLDPKTGVAIPFDKLHRLQSIIGRNIRNGRYGYEGPLLGEMTQLQKVLYNAESKIAADNGMSADLDEARKATREYQEAFGRQRNIPKNQAELRKQQANPEQFKEENEQERVDAAKKHDPTLAADYEKVKAHREAVKKMQTEDQLRTSLRQPILPPRVGHPTDTYNLKPTPLPPEKIMITPEVLKEKSEKGIEKGANLGQNMGIRRGMYAMMAGLAFGMNKGLAEALMRGVGAGVAVMTGSIELSKVLDKPEVRAWIGKVTPEKAAAWEKLPPKQKALFTQDMKALIEEADKKKIPVSPALRLFVTGTIASQKAPKTKTAQELVDEYNAAHPDKAVQNTNTGAAPKTIGNQSSVNPAWTHIFNPATGKIEAV